MLLRYHTPEVVKILNEAVFQKFENVEEKFLKWGYSKSSKEFVNLNFLAMKSLLKAFNENEKLDAGSALLHVVQK